jgi:PAS domain S-box-containing protein
MWNGLTRIFDTEGFPPRWECGPGWKADPLWGWLSIVSDVAVFGAYTTIPLILIYFLKKRPELPFQRLGWLFVAFIFSCGLTHLLDAVMFWWPAYRLIGAVKFVTAMISWGTALALLHVLPTAINFRSPFQTVQTLHRDPETSDLAISAPKKLSGMEDHLRKSLRAARMGTWSLNVKTSQAWLDTMMMSLVGLGAKAGIVHIEKIIERVHRDDREILLQALSRTIETRSVFNHSFRIYIPPHGFRWLQGRGAVVTGGSGEVERMVGVGYDITTDMAEQSERRVRSQAIEFATNGIVIADAVQLDNPIIYVNPAFEKLTGYRAEDVIGKNCRILQGPETDEASKQRIREAIRLQKECQVTILNYRRDGTPFWNNLQISPVENDEGWVTHFVGVQTDVTASVTNELRLREAQETADRANQAKSEFLANMSHEIRTPLTAILGCADSLCRELSDPVPLATAKTIRSQSQLLTGILNDILDLSKIEAGRLEIHREPVSILKVIGEVRSLLEPQANEKKLELLTTFDSMLPETIETDPLRFRQILLNLASNAIKFTEKGKVEINVRCERSQSEPRLVISVIDTGIGIPSDRLSAIFEAFTQVDIPIVRRAGGTGLGLTICQRLTEMLDGELTVVSEVNRGSTFTISLKLESSELVSLSELDQRRKLKESHEAMDILIPARILIAEDTRAIQYMLERMLTPVVDDVVVVSNGEEAVAAVLEAQKTIPFKLVLMDMQMPVMNGYDATARLRELGIDIPVIALTAGAMTGDRERCLAVGCTDYVSKPISRPQLLHLIQTYCDQSTGEPKMS